VAGRPGVDLRRPAALAIALAIGLGGGAEASAEFTPGATGLGDPFFPKAGNGGYDVGHYDLALRYRPRDNHLRGKATVTATAIQDLSAFDLDYRGPELTAVKVNGAKASAKRNGQELVITPSAGIPIGSQFTVRVTYKGRPRYVKDPDGSKDGWIPTDDGAFVVGEPQGAPTWFPCNDYPTDKATFDVRVKVPRGIEAVSNGRLISRRRRGSHVTWSWAAEQPMATYLATASVGNFKLDRRRVAGIASVVAVDPRERRDSKSALDRLPRIVRLFRSLYGPYPFNAVGALVDHAPSVGYALETQTRPSFHVATDDVTLAHEIAHQWFGDSVSLTSWPQMWLNEGFATWSEWRWTEAAGGATTAEQFRDFADEPASRDRIWDPPPAVIPSPGKLFSESVYVRGAMALEALRQRIGDEAFYATLRAWVAQRAYGNGTIDEFIALAEAQSAEDLDGLFQTWLIEAGKPV
jgi:aminopeptidase N